MTSKFSAAKRTPPKKEIFVFKAILDDYLGRVKGTPWRILAIESSDSLYDLGAEIVASFNFDLDHCFGFYNSLKGPSDSSEHYELFVDLELDDIDYGGPKAKSVQNTKIKKVFTQLKQKMLFLFDYGDNWRFSVELTEIIAPKPRKKYPYIIEKRGRSPEQYPSYE